ncbi:MAG TPA: hypothetical protein VMB25_21720 [Bryobacteraceae bacterium]|nr:hypothetical protein [Bryobacteraceae bacterium]
MKLRTKSILAGAVALLMVAALPGLAQDPNPAPAPSSGGWRRFDPSAQQPPTQQPNDPPPAPQGQPQGVDPQAPPPQAPPTVTLPAGTWITIRVNEPLSSDHSQAGDAFTATLAQPIVANGLLIARRGQTVMGRISEAKKAGRVSGTSRLGLQLTALSLADGRQIQIQSSLMDRNGNTSHGRDAAAIGATTATGAAIGAAVNGGVGAGVGAAAGVVASTIGVLLTRGRPTVVTPETPLTFQLQAPITIDNANVAFRPATQQDYGYGPAGPAPRLSYRPGAPLPPPPYYYGYAPAPYYYGYPYPYFYGPSLYFGFGGFYGRGFRRW